ncbi:MAG TPA: GFA family protein [Aestuariivirga sp.]|nr:GFA family protein [Aestuariivirga sp.]HRA93849.1 GFA family protein [Aestuariivirga sp.]
MKIADSGNKRLQAFCPNCGTSLYFQLGEGVTGHQYLRVGPLRQRDLIIPRRQYWHRSAQSWLSNIHNMPMQDTK